MPFITALQNLLGTHGVLTAPEDRASFERDWRGMVQNRAVAVALPKTTQQVSDIVKLCVAHGIAIVPQGGNTGLVAGGVPVPGKPQLIIGFSRMDQIHSIDLAADCLITEAGVPLAKVQETAAAHDRLFPVGLAAEGTAQIGGLISTNAGGVQVLSYGNMRAQVLGLEVVLADGSIWDGLSSLRKDNTGYDLKQVFIGAEGTLGLITSACLRLYPAPKAHATALVGVESPAHAMVLFQAVRRFAGPSLTICEYMEAAAMQLGGAPPFAAAVYVLLEMSVLDDADPQARLEDALAAALADGVAVDAVIAQSERQRQEFLALREAIPLGELADGGAIKHDIAVPLNKIAEMVEGVRSLTSEKYSDCRLNIFGHLGDGNLHINVRPPAGQSVADLSGRKDAITHDIEGLALSLGGSFSAEHGIGQMRLASMAAHKSPVALNLMRSLKDALDPGHVLNPGKTIPD